MNAYNHDHWLVTVLLRHIKKMISCVIEPILRKRYPISPPMLGNDEDHMEINPWNYEDVRSYGDENILKIIAWIMNIL